MKLCPWSTSLEMVSKTEPIVNYINRRQITMREVRKIMRSQRAVESKESKPRKNISPVTTWLLDDAINKFFDKFSDNYELELLSIQDKRQCSNT
jgi:hypothetical protein